MFFLILLHLIKRNEEIIEGWKCVGDTDVCNLNIGDTSVTLNEIRSMKNILQISKNEKDYEEKAEERDEERKAIENYNIYPKRYGISKKWYPEDDKWKKLEKNSLAGKNISLKDCAGECSDYTKCKAFVHKNDNTCWLSDGTNENILNGNEQGMPMDTYVKKTEEQENFITGYNLVA